MSETRPGSSGHGGGSARWLGRLEGETEKLEVAVAVDPAELASGRLDVPLEGPEAEDLQEVQT